MSKKLQGMTFSKKITVVDIISWIIITLALCTVMIKVPELATYCVSIETTITAAYVSLRLGYSAKSAVENYKKISNTITTLSQTSSDDDEDDDQQNG